MRSLKLLLAASVSALGLCIAAPASAQVTARVVASCGSPTYVAGTNNYQTVDTTGKLCGSSTGTINPAPTASSGASTSSTIVAANTTSVAIDASPGNLLSVTVFNNSATIAYAKFYDALQGSVTCGSGTPKVRIMIPANTSGAGATVVLGGGYGVNFTTGITRCAVTGIADNDATAPAASTYIVEADYK